MIKMINVKNGRISSDMFELLEGFYRKQLINQSKKKKPFRFRKKRSDEEVTLKFAEDIFLSHIEQENPNQISTCTKKFWFEYMKGNIALNIEGNVKITNITQAAVVLKDNGLSVSRNADGTYSIMLTEDDCVVYNEGDLIIYANRILEMIKLMNVENKDLLLGFYCNVDKFIA